MLMSSELMISPILTSAETDCAPSLIPPVPAICECSSIKPAVICLPVASITLAEPAAKFLPTALIFPPSKSTSAFCRIPSFHLSKLWHFLIALLPE